MAIAIAVTPRIYYEATRYGRALWDSGVHDYWRLVNGIEPYLRRQFPKQSDALYRSAASYGAAKTIQDRDPRQGYPTGIVADIGGTVEGIGKTIGGIASPVVSLGQFLYALTQVRTWIRVGEVIGGAILIILAVRMLARETNVPIPKFRR